jgi:hypothetical protein
MAISKSGPVKKTHPDQLLSFRAEIADATIISKKGSSEAPCTKSTVDGVAALSYAAS